MTYLVENIYSFFARLVLFGTAVESVEYGVDQQGQPCYPLHGQHQERVHCKGLTDGTRLELADDLDEPRVLLPAQSKTRGLVALLFVLGAKTPYVSFTSACS